MPQSPVYRYKTTTRDDIHPMPLLVLHPNFEFLATCSGNMALTHGLDVLDVVGMDQL